MPTKELLKQIRIPPEYAHVWDSSPPIDLSVRLESWRVGASGPLHDLASHLAVSEGLSTEEQSLLVIHVAQYVGHDPWVSSRTRAQAERMLLSRLPHPSEAYARELTDILESYVSPSEPLITRVLSSQVRPVFQSHIHPKVNPSTGRVLNRVAGGPLASQDLYASQSWKESHPGISNVLFWIVSHIKVKTAHVTCSACI